MYRLGRLGRGGRLVLALAVGGVVFGIATVVQASVPDAHGVIHSCYQVNGQGQVDGGANLRVIDPSSKNKDGQACKKNEVELDWNQKGPTGAKGGTGPSGPAGPSGSAGPGFQFTTATGNPGPTISSDGTYFIDAEVGIIVTGGSALVGQCSVMANNGNRLVSFNDAVNQPSGTGTNYSFTGMLDLRNASVVPYTLSVGCADNSNNPVTPDGVGWWVSKVS